ncbi:hypothetical protein HGRIS_004054 [Hohenbuehelia grisea]|uniref:F-box domain-containing protein n=1 Tax=Hohenbuehelia grisea TaxID=104357 RepID=A0ABR3JI48_9AGAR
MLEESPSDSSVDDPILLGNLPIDIALPNETLSAIFDQLSPAALSVLSRVSQRFRAVAERALYASISITDALSESSPVPFKTLRCCQTLFAHRHLANGAKKLHIRWQSRSSSQSLNHLAPALQALRDALYNLAALESLELGLGPANILNEAGVHILERIIDGCAFPNLRQCAFSADWAKGSPPYSNILAAFLTAHPSLRQLRLSDHHGPVSLPPEALPHLSSFRGSPDAAASILPGRPVTVLALVGQDSDVTRVNLPRMAHTSVPLHQLDLSAMSVRPVLLQNVSAILPGVRVLKVKLALRHTLHYALSGITSPRPPSMALDTRTPPKSCLCVPRGTPHAYLCEGYGFPPGTSGS